MIMHSVKAKFENGVFRPLEKIKLDEGEKVTVLIKKKNRKKISSFSGIWKEDDEVEKIMEEVIKNRKNFRLRKAKL
ncbi:MAG: hypothetical protein COS84_06915 [Armatimonadetes bacterium CG07_land_8_20_14_0_80_40_9]|nr:MAG: hypothetical protein COS84_06915 [Armatimonadetes bacterium CG07_land_8_20_14_0_80_40_9]